MKAIGVGASLLVLLTVSPVEAQVPGVRHVGFRISVEPEIVETAPGRLVTQAIVWKYRSVWVDEHGHEILVRSPYPDARDSKVRIDRDWRPTDFARTSRLFHKQHKAMKRFAALRNSRKIAQLPNAVQPLQPLPPPPPPKQRLIEVRVTSEPPGARVFQGTAMIGRTPLVAQVPRRELPVQYELREKGYRPVVMNVQAGKKQRVVEVHAVLERRGPTCEKVLIERGHNPSHLKHCKGVNRRCAVTLLRKGHSPIHLDHCRGVEPGCAVEVMKHGHHPMHLDKCTVDLRPRCVMALLDKRHHPMHLDNCSRVDDDCAVMLLNKGHHPNKLSSCRR